VREVIARRLRRAAALAAIACIGLGGCATFHPADPSALGGNVPPRAQVADVPFYPQKEKYCGPAALAMALTWSGKPISQDQAAALTFTPGRDGTFRADMVTAALRNGRLPVRLRNIEAVMKELAAGRPVIVFENRGLSLWHVWHYAVLTGYDLEKDLVIMHSGKNPDEEIGIKLFQRMWHRGENWSLVVLPPGTLPVDAEEHDPSRPAGHEIGRPISASATFVMRKRIIARPKAPIGKPSRSGRMERRFGTTSPIPSRNKGARRKRSTPRGRPYLWLPTKDRSSGHWRNYRTRRLRHNLPSPFATCHDMKPPMSHLATKLWLIRLLGQPAG
jgi:hypothetical protein